MSTLHTTFHSLSISCNTMKNWYIIIIMLSCQFFPPLSLPTRPTFSAFKENKWFFEESSYTAVGASAVRRWTTMKISFHHDCVASEDTAKIWLEANFFFSFSIHWNEKHIFMFVCSNEKLENHPRTINCGNFCVIQRVIRQLFAAISTLLGGP